MKRDDFLRRPVAHMKLGPKMTVNQLIQEFDKSGCLGAGRLASACNIFERMVRDDGCTIFLALAGAMIPTGLRTIIADSIRKRFVNVLVTTGANMVHDLIEAFGGHHYKGHWFVDDFLLYKYHIYRIYDAFVSAEDFVKADEATVRIFDEIGQKNKGKVLSTRELMYEVGSHLDDPNSILRAAYEVNAPVFVPAIRDSEFAFAYRVHEKRQQGKPIKVDVFKEVSEMMDIVDQSPRLGMVVIGGGVPRNTIQHSALMAGKGLDYAIIITMDRAETGGLSGSSLEETISWGKLKNEADKIMVISDASIAFPLMIAAVLERLGDNFERKMSL